jgi:hypothetical protein
LTGAAERVIYPRMLPDTLRALLVLQERDQRRVQLEKALAQGPRERVAVEARIAGHEKAVEAAKQAVMELELKRKNLETAIKGVEEQVARYKNQQLLVKKNDEYQALTHEIEQAEARRGQIEEDEIRVLYELDEARVKSKQVQASATAEITAEHAQLGRIAEREAVQQAELAAAKAEVERARGAVAPGMLPRYDRLARDSGLPVVVPLRDHKCGGCHLKVSAGVDSEARKGTEIVACDNCSRLLYYEP